METTAAAAKAQYDMAIEGARREDREAAEALVKQASGAVSEVESYISDAMQDTRRSTARFLRSSLSRAS